jgi:hypothetical protein
MDGEVDAGGVVVVEMPCLHRCGCRSSRSLPLGLQASSFSLGLPPGAFRQGIQGNSVQPGPEPLKAWPRPGELSLQRRDAKPA